MLGKITLTCTSGRRFGLFCATLDSFMLACEDIDRIGRFIVSDDGSSDDELAMMRHRYPFIEFTSADEPGQSASLNHLFSLVDTEWFLHIEDDWAFIRRDRFIGKLLDIAACDPAYRNVTLRKMAPLTPGLGRFTGKRVPYSLHRYNPRIKDQATIARTDCGFPGWTLNPGLQHTATVREIGPIPDASGTRYWDRLQAQKYLDAGYMRCSLNEYDPHIMHIGQGQSVYERTR